MVQQAVTQQDSSFTGGVLAISVFAVLTVALSWANSRWPEVRAVTHGVAVPVMEQGEPHLDVLRSERLSLDDLMAAARQQGSERSSDIRLAVLEANGQGVVLPAGGRVGPRPRAQRVGGDAVRGVAVAGWRA
jgi:uncharacterized membrane protein YcaP (DUF421 family)